MPKRRVSAKEKAEMKRLKQIERQREKDKERAKKDKERAKKRDMAHRRKDKNKLGLTKKMKLIWHLNNH